MSKQYVQHESGQGEKWTLDEEWYGFYSCKSEACDYWVVSKLMDGVSLVYRLPKSEYIPCDPPEGWEDVTGKYQMLDGAESVVLGRDEQFKYIDGPHNGPCFIVERRKS